MGWHLREIEKQRCRICGGNATVRLFTDRNVPVGAFCRRHGRQELAWRLNLGKTEKKGEKQ